MILLKSHLKEDYIWHSDSNFKGEASRRIFNRYNGAQVLFMINLVGIELENFTVELGQKIETLIRYKLPIITQSEKSALKWLINEGSV